MSIRDNVLAGLRLNGERPDDPDAVVEKMLKRVALWDEVKDILGRAGTGLSGGQQQRLCIARSLALEPECCSWMSRARRSTRSPPRAWRS